MGKTEEQKRNILQFANKLTSQPSLDLVFDIFKKLGWYAEANTLIDQKKIPKKTAFYNLDFYEKVLKRDLRWIPKHKSIRKGISAYIHTYTKFLYGPLRGISEELRTRPDPKERERVLSAWMRNPEGLESSERELFALKALTALNNFRKEHLILLEKEYQKGAIESKRIRKHQQIKKTDPNFKLSIAQILAKSNWLSEAEHHSGDYVFEESRFLLQAIAPRIRKTATRAVRFWQNTYATGIELMEAGFPDLTKSKRYQTLGNSLSNPALVKLNLEKNLITIAKRVFVLIKGSPPSPHTYHNLLSKGRKSARVSLHRLINQLSRILIQQQGKQKSNIPSDLARITGLLIQYLFFIQKEIGEFKPVRKDQNAMLLHRMKLAYRFQELGKWTGFEGLKEIGIEVQVPTGPGKKKKNKAAFGTHQKESHLAYESGTTWKLEVPAGSGTYKVLELFEDEVEAWNGSKKIMELLNNLFWIHLIDKKSNLLKEELSRRGHIIKYDKDQLSILTQVNDEIQSLYKSKDSPIPQRYILSEVHFSIVQKDIHRMGHVIRNDIRFNEMFHNQFDYHNTLSVIPKYAGVHVGAKGIVVWIMPKSFMKLIVRKLMPLFSYLDLNPADNSERAWFDAFVDRIKEEEKSISSENKANKKVPKKEEKKETSGEDKESRRISGTIKEISANRKKKQAQLERLKRKASSHHRRVILKEDLLRLWGDFDGGEIETHQHAETAVSVMLAMAAWTVPSKDITLQLSAVMLELADIMHAKLLKRKTLLGFQETRDTPLIRRMLIHVTGSIRMASSVYFHKNQLNLAYGHDKHRDRVKKLQELESAFKRILKKEQKGDKLIANKSTNSIFDSQSLLPLTSAQAIHLDGKLYTLKERGKGGEGGVKRSFTYSPTPDLESSGIPWSDEMVRDIIPSKLWLDGNAKETKWNERKGILLFELDIINSDGSYAETKMVYATDDHFLKKIRSILSRNNTVKQIEALGEAMETAAEWAKSALYVLPFGPTIMVADVVIGVVRFLKSPQFLMLKRALGGDGEELIKQSFDKVKGYFEPDKLWEMLLDDQKQAPIIAPPMMTAGQQIALNKFKHSKKSRMGRLFDRFRMVGAKTMQGLGKLKNTFNFLIKGIRMFVLSRPRLAQMFGLISDHFYQLSSLSRKKFPGFNKSAAKGLNQQLNGMLGGLHTLEVPKTIIPPEAIVDLVINLALRFIAKGPKKLVVKGGIGLLKEIGAYQYDC